MYALHALTLHTITLTSAMPAPLLSSSSSIIITIYIQLSDDQKIAFREVALREARLAMGEEAQMLLADNNR